jgi:hypothetical protein
MKQKVKDETSKKPSLFAFVCVEPNEGVDQKKKSQR